jgi:hypothetical protein
MDTLTSFSRKPHVRLGELRAEPAKRAYLKLKSFIAILLAMPFVALLSQNLSGSMLLFYTKDAIRPSGAP